MEKKKIAVGLMLAVLLVGVGRPVLADEATRTTGGLIMTKLFRGIVNAATGWIEIPKQMSLEWQAGGASKGLTWGFVKGIGYAVGRSVVGGFEIVTFPIPVPEDFRRIMDPEYVLSDMPGNPPPR